MKIEISVVIACYNGAATLAEGLDGLLAQDWEGAWEIILTDNGSTDRSVDIFRDYSARFPSRPMHVVDASAKRGKSFALNAGVAGAAGRGILINDVDDVAAPGWLRAMAEGLKQHDLVSSCSDTRPLNSGWVNEYRAMYPENDREIARLPFPPYAPYTAGANLGFKKEVFEAIGGFDPDIRICEDLDFCIRAYLAGYELVLVREAILYYRNRSDLRNILRQHYDYGFNDIVVARKFSTLGPPPGNSWRNYISGWRTVARMLVAQLRLANRRDMCKRARLAAKLGFQLGHLHAMVRYGRPPSPTG